MTPEQIALLTEDEREWAEYYSRIPGSVVLILLTRLAEERQRIAALEGERNKLKATLMEINIKVLKRMEALSTPQASAPQEVKP